MESFQIIGETLGGASVGGLANEGSFSVRAPGRRCDMTVPSGRVRVRSAAPRQHPCPASTRHCRVPTRLSPVSAFSLQQEVMEKYEVYRDSVDGLPSCQLEVQLYQKKIQELAENREKLAGVLKEVSCVLPGITVLGLGFASSPVPCPKAGP